MACCSYGIHMRMHNVTCNIISANCSLEEELRIRDNAYDIILHEEKEVS